MTNKVVIMKDHNRFVWGEDFFSQQQKQSESTAEHTEVLPPSGQVVSQPRPPTDKELPSSEKPPTL
jgi:hypothetical protein